MASERLADVDVEVLHETEKAIHVTDGKTTVWLPKSQCELSDNRKVVTMPEWLAIEKELV